MAKKVKKSSQKKLEQAFKYLQKYYNLIYQIEEDEGLKDVHHDGRNDTYNSFSYGYDWSSVVLCYEGGMKPSDEDDALYYLQEFIDIKNGVPAEEELVNNILPPKIKEKKNDAYRNNYR